MQPPPPPKSHSSVMSEAEETGFPDGLIAVCLVAVLQSFKRLLLKQIKQIILITDGAWPLGVLPPIKLVGLSACVFAYSFPSVSSLFASFIGGLLLRKHPRLPQVTSRKTADVKKIKVLKSCVHARPSIQI